MLMWEMLNLKQFCQHKNFWSAQVFPSTQTRLKATASLLTLQVTDFKVKEHNTTWQDSTVGFYKLKMNINVKRRNDKHTIQAVIQLEMCDAQVTLSLDNMEPK